jgi:hypothetical protein
MLINIDTETLKHLVERRIIQKTASSEQKGLEFARLTSKNVLCISLNQFLTCPGTCVVLSSTFNTLRSRWYRMQCFRFCLASVLYHCVQMQMLDICAK